MRSRTRTTLAFIVSLSISLMVASSLARAEQVSSSPEGVFDRALAWMTQNQMSPTSIDRANGLLIAERAIPGRGKSRQWATCPRRFNYVEHTSHVRLTVLVRPSAEGSDVTVTGVFESEGPGTNWVINRFQCESNGTLENELLAHLKSGAR